MNLTMVNPPFERLMIKLKPVSLSLSCLWASTDCFAGQHFQTTRTADQHVSLNLCNKKRTLCDQA
jgi:hypothetical protein